MSLPHAILGFLHYKPMSGYDLKKAFDISIQHFWPADQSQIYRTLATLAQQGWATLEVVPQEDRPDRKVYHITEAGRAELASWIAAPPPMGEPRSAPLIQVFFSGQLSDEEALTKFEGYAAMMRAILSQYEQVPDQIGPFQVEIPSSREHFFWLLTLECGMAVARAQLAWMESVVARIKNGTVPQQ